MQGKTGILLVNLGTPEATSFWPMRAYLKEFLSDKRVIEKSGLKWWLILNGIILLKRPTSSGLAYKKIWNYALNESPLKTITRAQRDRLAKLYAENSNIVVNWAMRYGKPSIAQGITNLMGAGVERILVFPLYPQYSAATTASVMDGVYDALKNIRHQPSIRTVPPYFDNPAYIAAISDSMHDHYEVSGISPDKTIVSMHGLPKAFVDKGDPYQKHCETTFESLKSRAGDDKNPLLLSYQSRSGREEWIGPDTEDVLEQLAKDGTKSVGVITAGFASDCVETLEEIRMRAKDKFLKAGGSEFTHVPCLNDSPASIALFKQLIDAELEGWAN